MTALRKKAKIKSNQTQR